MDPPELIVWSILKIVQFETKIGNVSNAIVSGDTPGDIVNTLGNEEGELPARWQTT